MNSQKKREFTLILAAAEESEDDANALYHAGCGDGSISTSGGVTRVDFHRESDSLEESIRSAIANVRSGGFDVVQVQLEPQSLASA